MSGRCEPRLLEYMQAGLIPRMFQYLFDRIKQLEGQKVSLLTP